jgi:Holliday junction resolvasome RuvABC endonuclease subunit
MNETFRIVSIDPGTNIGISIMTIDCITFEVVAIETRVVTLNNYTYADDSSDRLLEKLIHLNKVCYEIAYSYSPIAIFVESAFLNMRFPKAVIQLSQFIATIETTFIQALPMIKIFRYPPKYVKKLISEYGGATKDGMLDAINKIPNIGMLINTSLLTEHEVDAVAIGYVGLMEITQFPHLLYMY